MIAPPKETQSSFDQWLLLEDDNLFIDEIKMREKYFVSNFVTLAHRIDTYFSLYLLSQSIQLVMGGLKPVTSFSVEKKLYNFYRDHQLVDVFYDKKFSSLLFNLFEVKLEIKREDDERIEYYLYNPRLVSQLHLKHPKLLPFTQTSITEYIRDSFYAHIPLHLVYGLLFGIPISAVKQYSQYMNFDQCRIDKRRLVSSYGEGYYVWGDEEKRDVMIREKYKEIFFLRLSSSPEYRTIISQLHAKAQKFRDLSQQLFEDSVYQLKIAKEIGYPDYE